MEFASPNWTLCPTRKHFVASTQSLLRGAASVLPILVIPGRQCLTTETQMSGNHENEAASLKNFTDRVFSLPKDYWETIDPTQKKSLFSDTNSSVTPETVKFYRYPQILLEGNDGLNLYQVEWVWENISSPDKAFDQMKKLFFDPTYVDDESDLSLLESLPPFKNNPNLKAPTVYRALWRPRPFMTTRDWVQFAFADEETKSVITNSCIHPLFPDYHTYAGALQNAICSIIPGVGIRRGYSYYAIRFSPHPSSTGCIVKVCFWYSMKGNLDRLSRLNFPNLECLYLNSLARQFARMDEISKSGDQSTTAEFDLS